MLNSKENLDPKGILKNSVNDKRSSFGDISSNLTMSDADARTNRRVSFAPEVTLHKIDLVPQNRRQTIGHTSDMKDMNSSSTVSSALSELLLFESGFKMTRSGSELSGASLAPPPKSQLPHSPVHVGSEIPVGPVSPQKLSNLSSSDDENDDMLSSEDMEFTEPVKLMGQPVIQDDDTMEFTQQIGTLPVIKQASIPENPKEDDTMEFTQPIGTLPMTKQTSIPEQSKEDDTMEFTQQLPTMTNKLKDDTINSSKHQVDETMGLTQTLSTNKQMDDTMEFTQPLPVLKMNKIIENPVYQPSVAQNSTEEEMTMEITQPLNTITATLSTISEGDEEEKHDLIQVNHIPLDGKEENSEVPEGSKDYEMETTQVVSTIRSNTELNSLVSKFPSQASSVITTPIRDVSKSPSTDQATPQFPDVEIPIPTDLKAKRFSDMDDDNDQIHKFQKLTEISTTHKIPLTDESAEVINYPNYQPVTLSQFLNDLGIKFFDDIELDDVSNNQFNKLLTEQQYEFNDYVKANSKLLVYSLFEFSNKDLSRNIVEGRKLYQELNESIIQNNPDLFKDFYNSTFDEQESLKADFSLIQEYCKYKARTTWYTWRIQLMENLIIKLNAKYDSLFDDKQRIENNLKLIDEEFSVKLENLNGLKIKLSLITKLKAKFDNNQDEFNRVKSQLSHSKQEMIKIKAQVQNQTEELLLVLKNLDTINTKIDDLNFEIKRQQDFINNNKKFSINDIKLLNFNNKLLVELSGFKFIENGESGSVFKYQGFQIIISNNQVSVEAIKQNLFNEWILKHIIYSTRKIEAKTMVDKCKAVKNIIDKYLKIDKEIFKMSIKLPLQNLETNLDQLSFKVIFFKTNEFKINITFTSSIDLCIKEDLLKFNLSYEILKSHKPIEPQSILRELVNECHVPNEILTNAVIL